MDRVKYRNDGKFIGSVSQGKALESGFIRQLGTVERVTQYSTDPMILRRILRSIDVGMRVENIEEHADFWAVFSMEELYAFIDASIRLNVDPVRLCACAVVAGRVSNIYA